jgi:hypothetical protein
MKYGYPSFVAPAMAAAFAFSGCSAGGGVQSVPASTNGAQPARAESHHVLSWIKPGNASKKLLYVVDRGAASVEIYTYPKLVHVGELTGFNTPLFDCADQAGNVWVVDYGTATVYEYAHGGTTPINVLSNVYNPYECDVNNKTGDLAVATNIVSSSLDLGEVAIYHNASGSPTVYSDRNFMLIDGLAYDNAGNLFVDGYGGSDHFHYAELPSGSSDFTEITLSESPASPGAVRWDGHYVVIGDYANTLYQTHGATVVSTITLNLPSSELRGFLIVHKKVVVADAYYSPSIDIFAYPAGGSPKKQIASGLTSPWDVALSL